MSWDDSAPIDSGWGSPKPEEFGFRAGPAPKATASFGFGDDGGFPTDGGFPADGGDAPRDNTCRYCKQEGHIARDCPSKPANDGSCFNCGEQGHNKADCPNPRKFTGTCRLCSREGHSARDCPDKPPQVCRNCQQPGHVLAECTNPRKLDQSHIMDRPQQDSWDDMCKADAEEDFDAFKGHMLEYLKGGPDMTLDELESAFRGQGFRYYLYALTVDVTYDKCLVGPHGEKGMQYMWTLNKSARPRRSKSIAHRMAATPEENLERLKLAGTLEDEVGPFCHNCKEKGHIRMNCEIETAPDDMKERVLVKCTNCEAIGHRVRDCDLPRKNYDACRNCGEEGHMSSECENPRVASADTECRNCGGKGHFSKECPDKKAGSDECYNCGESGHRSSDCTNERVVKCRNCDERGHVAKDCPKPRDITRVKCNNCLEMGHFSRSCPNPAPAAEDDAYGASYGYGNDKKSSAPAKMGAWGSKAAAEDDIFDASFSFGNDKKRSAPVKMGAWGSKAAEKTDPDEDPWGNTADDGGW